MSEVSSTGTPHYSATCAHTTHHLCFHLCSVSQRCTYNSTAVYLCTHGPCFHLCSVLWWSAYNNTIYACITCVLTSAVSFGGLPTTLPVHALPVFSPLQCPSLVCLQHYSTTCACMAHALTFVVSFGGPPTTLPPLHA